MVAIAVFIGALVARGLDLFGPGTNVDISLACITAFLFTGAGNALNDYFDRGIDKVNHPLRPIPSGKIKPEYGLIMAIVLFLASLNLALFINPMAFLIVGANFAVMLSYEIFFKAKGVAGNLTISWLTATTFLFGGAAVMVPEKTFVLAALAFLATLGREIAKDIEDIQGDEGRYTLPMSVGTKKAGVVASLAMAAAVLLSPIPLLSELFSGLAATLYIILIAVTDAIFIYCIFLLLKERINASAVIKIGMLMALLAFLIGGVL